MKKTFSIISLGCPRNLVDSECIISEFKNRGYVFKDDAIPSHTVVINTCGFIEDAKKESIEVISKAIDAKKDGQVQHIIVVGCLSERYPKELKNGFTQVDEFRGISDFKKTFKPYSRERLTPSHYAYIKVSEGCSNKCSYCIIPYIKKDHRNRPIDSILKEAEFLITKGAKEIILIGQDTSSYGIDLYGKKSLAQLLKRLSEVSISKDFWIRVLYCHPQNLDKDVIKVIRDNKRICRYIDLPLEHISDRILKRMNRRTTKKYIISLIGYIRKTIPGVALRTSFIVGFPGEKESDFKELLSFIKETRFERLGVFRYSREEGTPAYRFKGQVPDPQITERFDAVMSLQQKISKEVNEKAKNKVLKVLVDEKRDEYYIGRTQYDAPEVDGLVYVNPVREECSNRVKGKDLKVGNFHNVRITDTYEYDLIGRTDSTGKTDLTD